MVTTSSPYEVLTFKTLKSENLPFEFSKNYSILYARLHMMPNLTMKFHQSIERLTRGLRLPEMRTDEWVDRQKDRLSKLYRIFWYLFPGIKQI